MMAADPRFQILWGEDELVPYPQDAWMEGGFPASILPNGDEIPIEVEVVYAAELTGNIELYDVIQMTTPDGSLDIPLIVVGAVADNRNLLYVLDPRTAEILQLDLVEKDVQAVNSNFRAFGFKLLETSEAVRATGRRQGLTGNSAKLFAGIAATPFEENVKLMLNRPLTGHWVLQHGIRNGNPQRAQPRTALGMALDYHWTDAVAVSLPRNAGPLLITRHRRMRISLWIHRRLRLATGDSNFDREYAVLGTDPAYIRLVLDEGLRSWLLETGIPAKTVLVLDGGWCYTARHEPLRLDTVPDRIALVFGFEERLSEETWTSGKP